MGNTHRTFTTDQISNILPNIHQHISIHTVYIQPMKKWQSRIVGMSWRLETLSVDNGWARFIVFLFADPHLLEGGEGSQDGSTDPDGVFPLWWGDDLDLHGGWGEGGDLFLHTVGDTREHGRS